jgi:hypothetical protein
MCSGKVGTLYSSSRICRVILVVVFSATIAVRVDGESLLPSVAFCLV